MDQETQGALCQPRGVGWGGKWEGGSKGKGYMHNYGRFMLRFERKQQNSIKQLSFNKKLIKKKQESSRKISTSALLTLPKPLTLQITTNC